MKKRLTLLDALDSSANTFEKALGKMNDRLSGAGPRDDELAVYNQLKAEHFQQLSKEFGPDSVATYIKHMEARRLKRRE